MKWSISKSKIFSQCQRKWYFSSFAASHGIKDKYRREIFLLNQLKSIYAWRGSLVDKVIERKIVPSIFYKRIPTEEEVNQFAFSLIEKQLEFGKAQKYRLPGMTKTGVGDIFVAFYDIEYNGGLDEEKIQEAIGEIKVSIKNLLESDLLKEIVDSSSYLIAQRTLNLKFNGVSVTCTPDLIVFGENLPPMIVDWKVHSFATSDYWLQLGVYGYILSQVEPHRDFKRYLVPAINKIENFRLIEYQLLKNKLREYSLSEEDIIEIEDYIHESITGMTKLVDGKDYKELDIEQFKTAYSPNVCSRCQFKKIYWGGNSNETN